MTLHRSALVVLLAAAPPLMASPHPPRAQAEPLIIRERGTMRRESPPHGAIGMSTAYRITDGVPARTMEFRRRILDRGAAIGPHRIAHDEVYYVLAGRGVVRSGASDRRIGPGDTAYLYTGHIVGIRQTGTAPLSLIIAYPLPGD